MSEVRLQVKHVSKNFGITKALKDVSFNINKGEVHALIGENGSGKSTMTNMLTGIYTLESGQFILDGKEVHPKNQVEANEEGISIIVQELGTLSGLTVAENIFLGHEDQFVHLGIKNTAAMNKKANELLQSYGFDKIKAGDMIDDYNFEDRKLVEIVKATYFNPKIVVVDETTTALSQEGREELYKQMNRVRDNGNTVIFISHDLGVIKHVSDRIAIMYLGRIVELCEADAIYENPLHPYTKALLSAIPPVSPFAKKERIVLKGDIPSPIGDQIGCPLAGRCPNCMDRCRKEIPKLKDAGDGHQVACFLYE